MSGPRRKIYYERDRAGWNNVRLQFETIVALAAITGRELVIPPPTMVAHIWEPYYELDMYSSTALASVVPFSLGDTPFFQNFAAEARERDLFHLGLIENLDQSKSAQQSGLRWDMRKYPPDKDWLLGSFETRILHFECAETYAELSPELRRIGHRAVYYGVRFQQHYVVQARQMLDSLGLVPGHFIGAHIRREDFTKTNPTYGAYKGETIAEMLNALGGPLPVLVATNALATDTIYEEFVAASTSTKIVNIEDKYSFVSEVDQMAITTLMLAHAWAFTGTLFSTYTLHVFKTRIEAFWELGDVDLRHLYNQVSHPWDNDHDCYSMYSRTTAWVVTTLSYFKTDPNPPHNEPVLLLDAGTRATTRLEYYRLNQGDLACPYGHEVTSHQECMRAIRSLGFNSETYWRGNHSSIPSYCSVNPNPTGQEPVTVFSVRLVDVHGRPDVAPVCRKTRRPTAHEIFAELEKTGTTLPKSEALGMPPGSITPQSVEFMTLSTPATTAAPNAQAEAPGFVAGVGVGAGAAALVVLLASLALRTDNGSVMVPTDVPHPDAIGRKQHAAPAE